MLRHLDHERIYRLRNMLAQRKAVLKKALKQTFTTVDIEFIKCEIEQLKLELSKRKEK